MKKLLIAIIYITIFGFATARYSDQFPLGTYSYISEAPWFMNNLSTLSSYMNQLGYNATMMETFNPNADLTQIYSTLNNDSIDVIVSDRAWRNLPGNAKYATTALSMGSYYRFEAEYSNSCGVSGSDLTDSQYWYGARSEANFTRIGSPHRVIDDQVTSNDYTWRCTPSTEIEPTEWAYTDLRWRWLTTANKNIRIGSEFSLHVDNAKLSELSATALQTQLALMEQQYVYIKYRLRFVIPEDDETYGSTILLSFHPTGVQMLYNAAEEIVGEGSHVPLIHTNGTQQGEVSQLSLSGYVSRSLDGQLPDTPDHPFVEIELKISYRELYEKGLLITDGATRFRLLNLNPRLHYKGHFILDIDYVDIEDNMHRQLMNNYSEYDLGVDSRIADIRVPLYHDMIRGIYTMDEPHQPQFDSFRIMQEMVASQDINTMTATEDYKYQDFLMDGEKFYDHQEVFRNVAEPKVIMPDPYPIKPIKFESTSQRTFVNWNDPSAYDELGVRQIFFQNVITDKVTSQYRNAKNYLQQRYPNDGKLYPVIQAFGKWQGSRWVDFTLPPAKTQTMLKYLPLCYGADGMYDYRLLTYIQHPSALDEYGALTTQGLSGTPAISQYPFTFNAIQEANNKINKYGPMLSQLNWEGAITITDNAIEPANANLSAALITSIEDIDINQLGPYGCYVECGYYTDPASNAPYLMLVNRRANYFAPTTSITEPSFVPISNYEEHFPEFDSQFITIYPDSSANTMFGTHIAYLDTYDNTLFSGISQQIPVEIEAGDAKLLQMCGTLPETVDSPTIIKHKGFIAGTVDVTAGGSVTIEPQTDTIVKANTTISLAPNTTFTLRGKATFQDNVTFNIPTGAALYIEDAVCTWEGNFYVIGGGVFSVADTTYSEYLEDSKIVITDSTTVSLRGSHTLNRHALIHAYNGSTLTFRSCQVALDQNSLIGVHQGNLSIINSQFRYTGGVTVRDSIEVDSLSTLNIYNSSFNDTPISVTESDLTSENCDYSIGSGWSSLPRVGIKINNTNPARICNIINTEDGYGFLGLTTELGNIDYNIGIYVVNANSPIEVSNVSFVDLWAGIKAISSDTSGHIRNSSFRNSETGIVLAGAIPVIDSCVFDACSFGIRFDMSIYTPKPTGVYNSIFVDCESSAIDSRASSPRIQSCVFNSNAIGLLSHRNSNLNLSNRAFNTFSNTEANIRFYDDDEYKASIQLVSGHNDFYHTINSADIADFVFDKKYYFDGTNIINASKNWFEGSCVIINPEECNSYVYVETYDPCPNIGLSEPIEGDRFMQAMDAEANAQYVTAVTIYKQVIDEQLTAEASYTSSCMDGIYRIALTQNSSISELSDYIDAKISQYATSDSAFTQLLTDYQVKAKVVASDFQGAIDIVQWRLSNATDAVDSLNAVLDMEIVFQLNELQSSKKPITTQYSQYKYPDFRSFSVKHEEHWNMLRDLLEKDNAETDVPIPAVPLISSNYPNPFNPSTTIAFSIPGAGDVKLCVYNIKGQKVKELLNGNMAKGHHKIVWNGRDRNNRSVSSGIYFLKLESGGNTSVRKAMLMK